MGSFDYNRLLFQVYTNLLGFLEKKLLVNIFGVVFLRNI